MLIVHERSGPRSVSDSFHLLSLFSFPLTSCVLTSSAYMQTLTSNSVFSTFSLVLNLMNYFGNAQLLVQTPAEQVFFSSVEDSAELVGVAIDCLGTELATFCIGGILLLLLRYAVGIPVVWAVWFGSFSIMMAHDRFCLPVSPCTPA